MITLSTNIQDSLSNSAGNIRLKKINTPNQRYVMLQPGAQSGMYTDMEYDLSETGRILDTESFVAAAFRKKKYLVIKEGFKLNGKNAKNIAYIEKRLEELEYVTGQSFTNFIEEVTENVVNFNNCFILKLRKESASSGNVRLSASGRKIRPIAGAYVLAAPTIDTANDEAGNITKYRHMISNRFAREFRTEDILHVFKDKRTGVTIGTPPLEAVRDDILALRTIEQHTENMIVRNCSPFIHVKVGTDAFPARIDKNGILETDTYAEIIDNMAEQGGVATPHRVDIKMLGSESQALRVESYLKYFKDRVLAGLGISAVDLGMAGDTNTGSAEIISNGLKDEVRIYQKIISNFISNYFFTELLLESDRYSSDIFIPESERVILEFIENDIDKRIKIENHIVNLFNMGIIDQQTALNQITLTGKVTAGTQTQPNNKSIKLLDNIITPSNQHSILKDNLDIIEAIIKEDNYLKLVALLISTVLDYTDILLTSDSDLLLISVNNIIKMKKTLNGNTLLESLENLVIDLCAAGLNNND